MDVQSKAQLAADVVQLTLNLDVTAHQQYGVEAQVDQRMFGSRASFAQELGALQQGMLSLTLEEQAVHEQADGSFGLHDPKIRQLGELRKLGIVWAGSCAIIGG